MEEWERKVEIVVSGERRKIGRRKKEGRREGDERRDSLLSFLKDISNDSSSSSSSSGSLVLVGVLDVQSAVGSSERE